MLKNKLNVSENINYSKNINIFWTGFSLYTICFILSYTINQPNFKFFNALQLCGVLIMLFAAFKIVNFKLENRYLQSVFLVYCFWTPTVILRGIKLDYNSIKTMLLDPYQGVFLYVSPLILLFPLKLVNLKRAYKAIILLGIIFLGSAATFYSRLSNVGSDDARGLIEYLSKTITIPCGFILLTYIYHSSFRKILSLIVIVLGLFFSILQARRGLIFNFAIILLFFFVVFVYNNKKTFDLVLVIIFLSPVIFVSVVSLMGKQNKLFKYVNQRMDEDTRSDVELYYYSDMKPIDWAFGRGMNGLVAAPFEDVGDDTQDFTAGYRNGIESDYLNIILKGGVVSLGLMLMITIPAIRLGFFVSKNTLSKASALWITLWILDLYPTTVTTFTLNYLLVWISVGICFSRDIRNMSDIELKNFLNMN